MGKYIENVSALLVIYSPCAAFANRGVASSTDWMLSRFGLGVTSTTEPQASMRVSVILFFALVVNPWVQDLSLEGSER
jgi:hypothetical protein